MAIRRSSMLILISAIAHASFTLPCDVHGLSVSWSGFIALLADRQQSRMLPLVVTKEDTETASSPEALTLLQMLQGIDLGGAILPPELLDMRCETGNDRSAVLKSVRVLPHGGCELCVSYSDAKSETSAVGIDSNFEALALAMRYSAPIEVDGALLDTAGVAEEDIDAAYPRCYTLQDARLQSSAITRRLAGVPEEAPPAADLDGLPAFDPATLALGATPTPEAPKVNANRPPPGMLLKALEIAKAKGDTAAIEKIQSLLDQDA